MGALAREDCDLESVRREQGIQDGRPELAVCANEGDFGESHGEE